MEEVSSDTLPSSPRTPESNAPPMTDDTITSSSPTPFLKDSNTPERQSSPDPASGVYVAPPHLTPSQKALYKSLNDQAIVLDSDSDEEGEVEAIVGEYREGDTLFYYARRANGICHRVRVFPAIVFCVSQYLLDFV